MKIFLLFIHIFDNQMSDAKPFKTMEECKQLEQFAIHNARQAGYNNYVIECKEFTIISKKGYGI